MATIGYIFNSQYYPNLDADREWMRQFGCQEIVEDEESQEALRPRWKQMLINVMFGDTIVISKLSNALRGSRELAAFFDLCRIKNLRLISINDRIDLKNELFPETTAADVVYTIAKLPREAIALRKADLHAKKLKKVFRGQLNMNPTKQDRNKQIINMYKSGYSVDDIWKTSGFKSRSSVFRIISTSGVKRRNNTKEK